MQKVIAFNVKGDMACFTKPFTNSNCSTYIVIPKSAVIGMMAAVSGYMPEYMKKNNLYHFLTEKIQYSVRINEPFHKGYWKLYAFNFANFIQGYDRPNYTPSFFEYLSNINYDIYLKYDESDEIVKRFIDDFSESIKSEEYVFPPSLGMANMFCDIKWIDSFSGIEEKNGVFETHNFCTNILLDDDEKFKNVLVDDDFPFRYKGYLSHDFESYGDIYVNEKAEVMKGEGNYCKVDDEKMEFI